jgi:hypothetical protein
MALKAIKQLIHEGKEPEAMQLYQAKFGASAAEAETFVNNLASGHSMVISNVTSFDPTPEAGFGTLFPKVGGTAVSDTQVQIFTSPGLNVEWTSLSQNHQASRRNPLFLSLVILILVLFLVIMMTVAMLAWF